MKHRILIIDDDADLCRLLKNNLELEGYSVDVCCDGETGLQRAAFHCTNCQRGILAILCLGLIIHDIRVRKQLLEWLDYLKNAQEEPDRKVFVQGSGTIAEINFQINQILANNREQLAKAAKSELASRQILTNLSHDVRTPLASLLGYLEALVKNGVQKEEQEEYLQVAYRKALDMRELVDILFVWFQLNAKEQVCGCI